MVIDSIRREGKYEILGIIDTAENIGKDVTGVVIIGSDADIAKISKDESAKFIITVGSVGSPETRIRLFEAAYTAGLMPVNVIDPTAVVSKGAHVGLGNYIGVRVVLNTGATIENNVIINTGAIIEHDCVIGDSVHIAPGVVLSGGVTVGRGSHIGTGAVVIQGVKIGENTLIGAGSVVVGNIDGNLTAYGNPCRKAEKNK